MGIFRVNRASFIEVKNRLFGHELPRNPNLVVLGKLIDTLTYSLITIFRTTEHYSQHVSSTALTEYGGIQNIPNIKVLKQKLEMLRQSVLRTSGVLIARKNKLTHKMSKGSLNDSGKRVLSLDLVEDLGEMIAYIGDLVILSNCVERDCLLDLFKSDMVMLQCKMSPALKGIMTHLESVARGATGTPLDAKFIDSKCALVLDQSKGIRSMLRSNTLLIHQYSTGSISLTEFLIQRNECSLKYIDCSPITETIFGESAIVLTDAHFLLTVTNDCLKMTETLTLHVSHLLNTVCSSTEFFFQLSTFLESELVPLTRALRDSFTEDVDFNFVKLIALMARLETNINTIVTLTNGALSLKEFRIDDILLRQTISKCHAARSCAQLVTKIASQRVYNTRLTSVEYQQRFAILIGSVSLCALGLEQSVGKYADKM